MEPQKLSPLNRYLSSLRGVVGASTTAYGFTLTVWSTGSILSHAYGLPSPPQVFMFFGGAIVAFAVVAALAFGGVMPEVGGSSNIKVWGSFRFLSVGLAVGAAWLESLYVPGFPGWPFGAFLATAVYLTTTGAENAAAGVNGGEGA